MDRKDLEYKRANAYEKADEKKREDIQSYAEGYKAFLNEAKTEREAVAAGVRIAEANGFKPFDLSDELHVGDKVYYNNRGKGLYLLKMGSAPVKENGVRILVAHVDSPRLDLKQVPLYESAELAYCKTHYYGGIKKYQWLTIPLALHGVVVLRDGTVVPVCVGEKENDPIFYVTDLLPHLSQEINPKSVTAAFPAENLNLLVGGIPAADEDKHAVKRNVLSVLYEQYGIIEEDLLSAELEAVPAYQARDVGFDRAFLASYGHDDRVCAYPELTALTETDTDQTVLVILADKEEIGSEGTTGMQCVLISDLLDKIAACHRVSPAVLRAKSKCLSADVTAAFDPTYAEAFEKRNASQANHGVAMNKFTGSRGKSGSNDASAEYVAYLRRIFAENEIVWQTGELGRVDLGGGGTVAMYLAKLNVDTVDLGVPVLSMHAPYEVISKADLYEAHRAFSAFLK